MLKHIITFSVNNKLLIGLLTGLLVIAGVYNAYRLPIDAVPDITDNQVQVITVAPSYGATDIERLVTFPIEQVNNNIDGLKEIRSFSRFGLSLVTIVFEDHIDIYKARQQVAERLQKVQSQIPKDIGTPELGPVSTGLGEIYQYVLRPDKGYENKYDISELRTLQDWIVRRQLLGIKGIAEVSSFGGKLKQFSVEIDPDQLKARDVNISDVFKALENNNSNTGGAYIEQQSTVLYIRSEGLLNSTSQIEETVIKPDNNGHPIFIRDVATIKIGHAVRYGALTYNDYGEVAGGIVMMLKGGNSSEIIRDVKKKVEEIKKTLPKGVILEPFLDRTKMVNNAIGTVETNLTEGALIVVFILVLFLGNVRAGLLVASVIPLAMLFAVIMMNAFGVSGNLMSLGALDFGLIVDGAVIIVEAVMHQTVSKGLIPVNGNDTGNDMNGLVSKTAGRIMNSAVFGQAIILIVYLPILTLEGIEGKMFKPMAQTVSFALLGAFILSLTYIPMMSALIIKKPNGNKPGFSDRLMAKLENGYRKMLQKALHYPIQIIAIVSILFTSAVIIFSNMGGEFIPTLEEGDFALETRVLPGSNLNVSTDAALKSSALLKNKFPEIEKIVTKIGSGEVPTDPMPIEAMDMMIILKDKKDWTSAETFDELSEKMGKELEKIPGVTYGFQYPVQMRFNELMTGAKQDVVCKIFGENLDTLTHYASLLDNIIQTIDGAEDIYIETVTGLPEIIIEYNRPAIAQYNMTINDINNTVNMAFAGKTSGHVYEGEKKFDLVVRLTGNKRNDLSDVRNLLVHTPDGHTVPLSSLANVEIKDGPNQIQRENTRRRIIAGFNVKGRDVESIVNELQQKADKQLHFAPGYSLSFGGAFENLQAAKKRLLVAVPISLVLIFILLYFAFNSVKQGLLIYTAIPLSAIGGIFFLALRGMPFSISAGIGFIALFGVAVLNGIVLIAEFNRLKSETDDSPEDIVLKGASSRLRPVLMTAAVASLGFLPMALSNGAGAEVQRPLATVVIGGLIIATFLTLFLIPIIFTLMELKTYRIKLNHKNALMLLICVAASNGLFAQKEITLQAAIDTAIKNNRTIKIERLKLDYRKAMAKTAIDIQPTIASVEYGQINSSYSDLLFGLSQTINFPTVYKRQQYVLREEVLLQETTIAKKELQLKKEVTDIYIQLSNLFAKQQLMLKNDTLYNNFAQRASQQFEKGESNLSEKTIADNQLYQLRAQLELLKADIAILELQFQYLLNTYEPFIPEAGFNTIEKSFFTDSAALNKHPEIQAMARHIKIAQAQNRLEKSKLLPDLTAGYSNMSMRGYGADNILYTSSTRFQSFQFGIGIPIFYGSQKAHINATAINETIAVAQFNAGKSKLAMALQQAYIKFQQLEVAVKLYENQLLPNARIMKATTALKFEKGEIDYLEFVLLTNQAIATETMYIDTLKDYNISINHLNNFTSEQP
ncbi:MAG: CusA/CzcA family heavy metal efflux RND transporter [Bacteroidota bacterium]